MIIKNYKNLATTEARKNVLDLIEEGLKSVQADTLVNSSVKYDEKNKTLKIRDKGHKIKGRIFVVGGGKAAGLMAEAVEKVIGINNIEAGVINSNVENNNLKKIKVIKASHPIPDENGVLGVEEMLSLKVKYDINEKDIILCLITGGGSALMPSPIDYITLEDKRKTTKILLNSGATIHEINAVRKHLSKIKGGRLAQYFYPAQIISLIISDVIGNDLDVIASGMTVPDKSTFDDAYKVLSKYNLSGEVSAEVEKYLKSGYDGKEGETPKKLVNAFNYIIGDSSVFLKAVEEKARDMNYSPKIVTAELKGDPESKAKEIAKNINEQKYGNHDLLIMGGETTPVLPAEHGQGGRNQHFVLASINHLKRTNKKFTVASMGTDGCDYLHGIGGAIADNNSIRDIINKKLNIDKYLKTFDSFTIFNKIKNSIIKTDNTGTNVGDIIIYIVT